jgi:hypothetical protein
VAQDDVTRWGALNVAVMSMLVTGTSASMLTNPTPAEEGYRAWQVYVEPLPADGARSKPLHLLGANISASGRF